MTLAEKLPSLSDTELKNLLSNAERLGESGTDKQQQQAASLLPLVTAELEQRKAAKLATAKAKRSASVTKRNAAAAPVRAKAAAKA